MTDHSDVSAIPTTSRDAYFLLVRKLQNLRLCVMRLAMETAHAHNASTLSINDIQAALRKIVQSGLDICVNPGRSVGDFPEDAYEYLARRLLAVHMVLTGWAAKFAQDARASADVQVVIEPEHVEQAWKEIGTPSRLGVVLLGDAKAA